MIQTDALHILLTVSLHVFLRHLLCPEETPFNDLTEQYTHNDVRIPLPYLRGE